jgi:hypothetical protein
MNFNAIVLKKKAIIIITFIELIKIINAIIIIKNFIIIRNSIVIMAIEFIAIIK